MCYVPGGGSGGGLGSCVSNGGRLAKVGRVARRRATSTGCCQRSPAERSVGNAEPLKMWLVVCDSKLHSGQRSGGRGGGREWRGEKGVEIEKNETKVSLYYKS